MPNSKERPDGLGNSRDLGRRLILIVSALVLLFSPKAQAAGRTGAWSATGALVQARCYHTATLLPDGLVLAAGGYNGSTSLASAEIYKGTKLVSNGILDLLLSK